MKLVALDELIELESLDTAISFPAQHNILVAPAVGGISQAGFFRLCSAALLQHAVLSSFGTESQVYIGQQLLVQSGRPINSDLIKTILDIGVGGLKTPLLHSPFGDLLEGNAVSATIWIHPDFLSREAFRDFYTASVAGHGTVSLHCPERTWFSVTPGFLDEKCSAQLMRVKSASPLLYCAQNCVGAEVDLAVLQLAESANVFWYLEATLERMTRFPPLLANEELLALGGRVAPFDPLVISILRAKKFIRVFLGLAGTGAGGGDFVAALGRLLWHTNRYLNHPDFRARLSASKLSSNDGLVFSGIFELLSDMVTRFKNLG